MNAIVSIGISLLAAAFPTVFPGSSGNYLDLLRPDMRIEIVMNMVANPDAASVMINRRVTQVTKNWKKIRIKSAKPFLPSAPVILEAWMFEENPESLRWPIQEFNQHVPNVTISLRNFSQQRIYLNSLKDALTTGTAPDIVMIHSGWMDELRPFLMPAPEPLYIPDECYNFFFKFACDAFSNSGKTFAIPIFVKSLVMIVNRDMLRDDRVVIGDRPSQIWKDFIADEKNFRKFFDIEKNTFIFLDHPDHSDTASRLFSLLMAQSEAARPSEAVVRDAVGLITKLYSLSEKSRMLGDRFKKSATERFLDGDIAVIFGTEDDYLEISKSFLQGKNTMLKSSSVDAFMMPQVNSNKNKTYGESWGFAVPANAKNADAAWAFLAFLSEEENIKSYSERSKKTASRSAMVDFNIFRESALLVTPPPYPFETLDFKEMFNKNIASMLLDSEVTSPEAVVQAIILFLSQHETPAS